MTVAIDLAHTRRFLSYTLDPATSDADAPPAPASCLEIRIFNAEIDRGGFVVAAQRFPKTIAGWYDRADSLVAELGRIRSASAYCTVNPVDAALLARADNRLLAKAKHTTTDADVPAIRWLYIDVDATRPADISSTDAELATAIERRDMILRDHPDLATAAIWGCSGNGGWILVRLPDLANDAAHRDCVARALALLAGRYTDAAVKVDPTTKNPSRVMCLPGTVKAKGSNRPDRPWRLVTVDGTGAEPGELQPIDLRAWLKKHEPKKANATGASKTSAAQPPAPTARSTPLLSVAQRAAAYLEHMSPAISGQRGHDQTFDAACALVKGFNLSIGDARPILTAWNSICVPPWSPTELEHKLADADEKPDERPRGYLLEHERQDGTGGDGGELAENLGIGPAFGAALANGHGTNGNGHTNGNGNGANGNGNGQHATQGEGDRPAPGTEANPHRLARLFVEARYRHHGNDGLDDTLTLRYWREEFFAWDGTCYRLVPPKEIRADLTTFIAQEFERLYTLALIDYGMRKARAAQDAGDGTNAGKPPTLLPVTTRLLGDVLQAIAGLTLLTAADCPVQPAWLDHPLNWPTGEILAARNALVHLPTFADPRGDTYSLSPTPTFFSSNALDYDFDPAAPEPTEWLKFLRSLWPDDPQSIDTLQEWFGYTLTPDTSQQKILMVIGPPRSGKGTIGRINKAIVGESNVVAPTLSSLDESFGLSPLIGKTLAIVFDARLSGRADSQVIVERLLSISGEDAQTINRKHISSWNGQLPTRFCLISNLLPRLGDSSGALPSRMVVLQLTKSFLGCEDRALFEKLLVERSSILLWAIRGWIRLRERGRFVQPAAAQCLVDHFHDMASPIQTFIDERCELGPERQSVKGELYMAWRNYCSEKGIDHPGDEGRFGKDLYAAVPGLEEKRPRKEDKRVKIYVGIGLAPVTF